MRRVALVLLVALGAVLGPAGAARAEFGISDAGPGIFTDWRFTDLGVRHVRLVVPWDVAVTAPQATDAYVQAALRTGVAVHVAFEHGRDDRCPGAPCTLPSVADYREAFAAFRRRAWPSTCAC